MPADGREGGAEPPRFRATVLPGVASHKDVAAHARKETSDLYRKLIINSTTGGCIETKLILLALLPILSLILVLAWTYMVIARRPRVKINLAGFGVRIELDSNGSSTLQKGNI